MKVLRRLYPTFNELPQFRHQYAIARHLDSPYIIQSIALELHGNDYAANSAFSYGNYGLSLFLSAYQVGLEPGDIIFPNYRDLFDILN